VRLVRPVSGALGQVERERRVAAGDVVEAGAVAAAVRLTGFCRLFNYYFFRFFFTPFEIFLFEAFLQGVSGLDWRLILFFLPLFP